MTNIESSQSPTAKADLTCHHGYPVVHRISRRLHSYGRSFSTCPVYWEDPDYCHFFSWDPDLPSDEPGAQAPVKQYQNTAEYTASASCQVKRPAASSTEDLLQVGPSSLKRACTRPDSPSREYGRPGPPWKHPATPHSEFRPARPAISEEVVLDALPAISIYVRELKRQISTLQESNEIMESRILQLEKQLLETGSGKGLIDHLSDDSSTSSSSDDL